MNSSIGHSSRRAARTSLAMLIGILSVSFLLSGCGAGLNKTYIEPEDEEGQACLIQCRSDRFECRKVAEVEHRRCEARYIQRERNWQACVATRGQRRCATFKPYPCPPANYSICSEPYDGCFRGCGGVLEIE